ncbi:Rad2 nuclease [Mactra antiquata]
MEAGPTFGRKSTNLRTIATTHAGRVVQQMELSSFINPMKSTSDLENFHQLILMYCAKRYAYTPPFYRIRNLLAALDHNHHADRPMKLDKHGEQSLIQVSQMLQ